MADFVSACGLLQSAEARLCPAGSFAWHSPSRRNTKGAHCYTRPSALLHRRGHGLKPLAAALLQLHECHGSSPVGASLSYYGVAQCCSPPRRSGARRCR